MVMNLFLDNESGLEKLGEATTKLSENPDDWQDEIIDELYRQAPYTGDFSPRLVMNKLDPERRYGMGAIEIKSQQAMNPRDDKTKPELQGVKKVLVPVIINDGKMHALDTIIYNGKMSPLTEDRLRRVMFRPQAFEAISRRPGDQDMANMLYPPYRTSGMGAGNLFIGSLEKASSPNFLMDAIRPTIKEADIKKVEDELNNDPTLLATIQNNEAALPFFHKLAEPVKIVSSDEMVKSAMEAIPPKIVQISKSQKGFMVKTANPDFLLPQENEVDRPTAQNVVGDEIVRRVERDGTVTIATDAVVKKSLADVVVKTVDEFGTYKVKTREGTEIVGWVFPKVVDLDGTVLDMSVFSNGSASAIQDSIAGSPVGKGSNLIDEEPEGLGCFYLSRQGGAVAIAPVSIKARAQGPEMDQSFIGTTILGNKVTIKKVVGLGKISKISEGVYGIPNDCGWLPLNNVIKLAENADEFMKTAQVMDNLSSVHVMYDGSKYFMNGRELEKISAAHLPIQDLSYDQAVYNLSILRAPQELIEEKLASARTESKWHLIAVRPVTLAAEKFAQAKTAAAKFVEEIPKVDHFLLKEAASVDDPLSVDKILSLGFLNPENVSTFISYLPDLEECVQKLSEILIASRLGMKPVDSGIIERAIRHLDKVIVGLRKLSQYPQA
jgi:hypothetical protein